MDNAQLESLSNSPFLNPGVDGDPVKKSGENLYDDTNSSNSSNPESSSSSPSLPADAPY